ncbi:hypothetical protein KQY30_35905 [Streptomyces sp. GMY02]|uniref:hypothetical protein n=1 Tax=Streptomyces sp. GMY02 TaxID=1333528 RepID=UPI001C2CB282|nr:hypothetical protein [Streptomyces sp. GMY02]QXE38787.1 hypothetical protein KQY30_35905 [Streptomyces sp. GMY02]
MGEQMDMALLRRLIDGVLLTLYTRYTAKELPALCERPGLPVLNEGNTKHERLVASLNACPDDHLAYPGRFMALLSRLWHLDNDPLGGRPAHHKKGTKPRRTE